MNGFIEIIDGLWYEEATGLPFSSKKHRGYGTDGDLKQLTCINNCGYYQVIINGKIKKWHRLVFEYFNGEIPSGLQVDHINNIRTDNRISNLQLLSNKENARYRKKQCNNTSGLVGASYDKRTKKWQAQININGKDKYLGRFETAEEAHQAYLQAKIKYHGKESIRAL